MEENKNNIIPVSDSVRNKNGRFIKIIGISALLLILLMVVVTYTVEKSGHGTENLKNDPGYIVCPVLPDNIRDIKPVSSGIALLTSTSVDYIDSYGRRLDSNTHLYAQPVIKTNKSTVLLYNKGGDSFRIERNGEIYNTYKVNGTMTFAELGQKNNYAYVINDDEGYQSHLFVYSFQGKKQFEWGSSSEYLVTAALSPTGKGIAVGLVGVRNGEYYSHIMMFDFKSDSPSFSVEFPDSTICEISFEGRNRIAAVTDKGLYRIDKEGNQTSVLSYSNKELCHASVNKSISGVAVAKYGDVNNTSLYIYDRKFSQPVQRDYKTEITMLSGKSDRIAVVFDDSAEIIGGSRETIANIEIGEDIILTNISGNRFYVLTLSGLYVLPLNKDISVLPSSDSSETETLLPQQPAEQISDYTIEEDYEETIYEDDNLG